MDIAHFQVLALISVLTTLTTECIKTFCNKIDTPYISNIIAAVVSVILSAFICIIYPIIMNGAVFDTKMVLTAVIMAFFGVLCATLGYDKVVDTLKKIKEH